MNLSAPKTNRVRIVGKTASILCGAAFIIWGNACLARQGAERAHDGGLEESSVIGVLKSRQYIVEMQGSDQGTLYTVKNLTGSVLAEDISADEVVAQFPRLHHVVNGVADDASLHGAELGGASARY